MRRPLKSRPIRILLGLDGKDGRSLSDPHTLRAHQHCGAFWWATRLEAGNIRAQLQAQFDGDETIIRFLDALKAPDLTIGASSVTLEAMRYRLRLDLRDESGRRVRGELTLAASPGRLVPPIEITGTRGWLTGYVVPVPAHSTTWRPKSA